MTFDPNVCYSHLPFTYISSHYPSTFVLVFLYSFCHPLLFSILSLSNVLSATCSFFSRQFKCFQPNHISQCQTCLQYVPLAVSTKFPHITFHPPPCFRSCLHPLMHFAATSAILTVLEGVDLVHCIHHSGFCLSDLYSPHNYESLFPWYCAKRFL